MGRLLFFLFFYFFILIFLGWVWERAGWGKVGWGWFGFLVLGLVSPGGMIGSKHEKGRKAMKARAGILIIIIIIMRWAVKQSAKKGVTRR
jgi:hypothetical protein